MIIDNIENIERYFSVLPGIREFIEALRNESLNREKGEYPFSDGLRYINNEIEAHPDNPFEVHVKNIDVHIVMEGYERQEYSTQIYAVPKNYDSDKPEFIGFCTYVEETAS